MYMEKAAPVACVQSRHVGPVGEKICPEEESKTNVATCWIIKALHALLTFNYYCSSSQEEFGSLRKKKGTLYV